MSQAGIISTASGPVPPAVPTSFATSPNLGIAVPVANLLTLISGNGISITASGATVTFNVVNDSFLWTDEAVSFAAVAQNGYFCSGVLTATLPVIAGLTNGATIIIYVDSASVVTVKSNTGQTIQIGSGQSSVAGTANSTAEGSVLTLSYRIADAEWHAISVEGTWSLS